MPNNVHVLVSKQTDTTVCQISQGSEVVKWPNTGGFDMELPILCMICKHRMLVFIEADLFN